MTMAHLWDLFSPLHLFDMLDSKYVRRQEHPTESLVIFNYTHTAQIDQVWNPVTRQCRGLITTYEGDIVARSWPKFYNYGEPACDDFDLSAPVEVTDKLDGSLGIMYWAQDERGWAIATRGAFASDQALHATRVLRTRYADFEPPDGKTVLFEIVYPENRIVLDYGDLDDLILLGMVDIETGATTRPEEVPGWSGPKAETLQARTLAEALALPPRPNAEGVVVTFGDGRKVKLKQNDYVALHRIVTGCSARVLWEYLAVNACGRFSAKALAQHLHMDPERVKQIQEVGPDWLEHFLAGVPDEFYAWVRQRVGTLNNTVVTIEAGIREEFADLDSIDDRGEFARRIADHPHRSAFFLLRDGKDISVYLWRLVYPGDERPFANRSEDVA